MTTVLCSTTKDPTKRDEPKTVSSVHMEGNWTHHAYKRSYDGKNTIVFDVGGFSVFKGKAKKPVHYRYTFHGSERGFYWHPDNRRVAYWGTGENDTPGGGRSVVVLDMGKVNKDGDGGPPPHTVLYSPPKEYGPFGLEWSPSGDAIYVVEEFREDFNLYSRIVRVDVKTKVARQIVRIGGSIDFFMPPVSRFENGSGPSSKRYWIVYGHATGLFLTDPKGSRVKRVSKLPATGLHNIEWHPTKAQLTLYFKQSITSPTGERFKGVYLVHLDRIGRKDKGDYLEQLYGGTDVHTLWYSPQGKYVCWATPDAIFYRKPFDPPASAVKLIALHDELELEIKGITWHGSETKLAFTAGNHLFVHEVGKPDEEPVRLASFGKDVSHFTAEPIWVGDEVFLTVFEDLTRNKKKKARGSATSITIDEEKTGRGRSKRSRKKR